MPDQEANGHEREKPGNKRSWTSKFQYPEALIGVFVAVVVTLILASTWFCWKIKKTRASANSRRPDIDSLRPRYEVQNEYIAVPDFNRELR